MKVLKYLIFNLLLWFVCLKNSYLVYSLLGNIGILYMVFVERFIMVYVICIRKWVDVIYVWFGILIWNRSVFIDI